MRSASLLVVAAAVLWGTTGTARALGPSAASAVSVGTARLVLGGAVLALLALRGGSRPAPGVTRRQVVAALVTAAAIAAYQPAFFAGVGRAGVALGTVVGIGSAPAVTGLLDWLVSGTRPSRAWALATALAVMGCTLLVSGPTRVDPLGIALALVAGVAYAVYTVGAKILLETGWAPATVMAVGFGGGALLAAPLLARTDLGWLAQPRGMAVAAWLALATMGLAYELFGRGLAALPPATVATLSLAEPLTAALLGVAVLGERPGPTGALGALLVLGGLVVLARPGQKRIASGL